MKKIVFNTWMVTGIMFIVAAIVGLTLLVRGYIGSGMPINVVSWTTYGRMMYHNSLFFRIMSWANVFYFVTGLAIVYGLKKD